MPVEVGEGRRAKAGPEQARISEREAGRPVYYGDASRRPMLEKVGGARARAFVVTSDDAEASERTVRAIRAAWPAAGVLARARDGAHARRLYALGVSAAVPETLEGSLQLGAEVLAAVGLPEEAVDTRVEYLRVEEVRRLSERAFAIFGCAGVVRVDFRMEPAGALYCLEINTVPGMTELSLVPMGARAAGIEYPELVERMALAARSRFEGSAR